MRKTLIAISFATLLATISVLAGSASAVQLFWDGDGAGTVGGGLGTWDNANLARWSTTSGGNTYQAWNNANNDTANFIATVGNVTVTGPITADSIRFGNTAGAWTFVLGASGALTLTSGVIATDTATTSTNANIFPVPITVPSGGNLIVQNNTMSGNSSVQLSAANTYGDLRYTSTAVNPTGRNQVVLQHLQAISSTATVRMDRNGAQLGFGGTLWDAQTFPNNIILNEADSAQAGFLNNIGVNGANEIEYTGVITSNATGANVSNLRFMLGAGGGAGALNLHNAASYNGTTTFINANATTAGVIRNSTGADNALPATTRFIFGAGNTAASGAYDLNGRSQTITGISTVAGTTGVIGGVINTNATNMGTLIIDGSATHPAYTGNIGVAPDQNVYKTGGGTYAENDNIAVVLHKNNSSTVTFSRPAGMTYSGGTTIDGGTLLVANTTGSGTGSGAVTVNSGGTLTGTGAVSGNVNVNGGTLAGTLNLSGNLTFDAANGGTLAPGASPGTITMTGGGTVVFSGASVLNYELNGGNTTVGMGVNDLLNGVGALTLDGTLNVSDSPNAGSFATATAGNSWRLINYGGVLSDMGLTLGTMPTLASGLTYAIDTSITGQVNLLIAAIPEASSFLALGLFGATAAAVGVFRKRLRA